jgi:hypothetical protein
MNKQWFSLPPAVSMSIQRNFSHSPLKGIWFSEVPFLWNKQVFQIWSVEITNKLQLCNRIYYSKFYWRLNMFRAANHSSSGALNCICSLWFIYTFGDRPLSRLSGKIFPLSLDYGRSPHVYINESLQIQFRAPDDVRYAARNMLSIQ